jgi:hypothetical protein
LNCRSWSLFNRHRGWSRLSDSQCGKAILENLYSIRNSYYAGIIQKIAYGFMHACPVLSDCIQTRTVDPQASSMDIEGGAESDSQCGKAILENLLWL